MSIFHQSRAGTRGGKDQFKYENDFYFHIDVFYYIYLVGIQLNRIKIENVI